MDQNDGKTLMNKPSPLAGEGLGRGGQRLALLPASTPLPRPLSRKG